MVESANDAILSIDTETGRVLGANRQACSMTSYSVVELQTRAVWSLHPPEEEEAARALFEQVRRDGEGACDELHFQQRDGHRVAIDVRANVIEFAGRRVIQRICRDITERRQRERALARHRALEDLVLDISTRFIGLEAGKAGNRVIRQALTDLGRFAAVERSYVYVLEGDDGMSQMFVWGSDEIPAFETERKVSLAGFEWALARLEADETVAYSKVEAYPYEGEVATPRIRELALRYPAPGVEPGQVAVLRNSVAVPMRSEGRLLGFLGFDRLGASMQWSDEELRLLRTIGNILGNALARMAAEEALMEANDALEAKVERRTRQLREKQAQLVQSEKMASLGQLVAGLAHEINTPLGALVSGSRTLRRTLERIGSHPGVVGVDDGSVHRWAESAGLLAETMQEAAGRIDQVVTSLRRFARLDRSAVGALDMREAAEDALNLIRPRLAPGVTVHCEFDEVPPVTCRAADIHQLLLNLLLNACAAVPPGGQIWVRLSMDAAGIRAEVEDTGAGIPAAILSRIFDPGFTTKGVGVGAGLGLAIAHQIVDEHRGWIRAESPAGAKLTVWLPLRPEGLSLG